MHNENNNECLRSVATGFNYYVPCTCPSEPEQNWESRFENTFSYVGWIPEHKQRMLKFVTQEIHLAHQKGRQEAIAEVRKKVKSYERILGEGFGFDAGYNQSNKDILSLLDLMEKK